MNAFLPGPFPCGCCEAVRVLDPKDTRFARSRSSDISRYLIPVSYNIKMIEFSSPIATRRDGTGLAGADGRFSATPAPRARRPAGSSPEGVCDALLRQTAAGFLDSIIGDKWPDADVRAYGRK